MTMLSVRVDPGNRTAIAVIEDLERITKRGIRQGWFRFAKDLRSEANTEILRRPKSGRTYISRTRGGRRRRHVASAPGETHANFSGTLRRSLSWKVRGADSMEFGYGVSTRVANAMPDYAEYVEFGTPRMSERPSLQNAINATTRNAEKYFTQEIEGAFE